MAAVANSDDFFAFVAPAVFAFVAANGNSSQSLEYFIYFALQTVQANLAWPKQYAEDEETTSTRRTSSDCGVWMSRPGVVFLDSVRVDNLIEIRYVAILGQSEPTR